MGLAAGDEGGRTQEMKEIADFAKLLGCDVVASTWASCPTIRARRSIRKCCKSPRGLRSLSCKWAGAPPGDRPGVG